MFKRKKKLGFIGRININTNKVSKIIISNIGIIQNYPFTNMVFKKGFS